MKVLIIANNIVGNFDGIGKHARIVGAEMNKQGVVVEYSTGMTLKKSRFGLFVSLEMSKAYLKAMSKIIRVNFDYVDIEYPFNEYNPLVLVMHFFLWVVSRFVQTQVAFSMHEYDRVNPLRRFMIKCMLPFTDLIFISEDKYFKSLQRYSAKMHLRIIPSHGISYVPNSKDFSSHNCYCYFGLVNKSKAFDEMLQAWDEFNVEGKYHLDIVTITDLSEWNLESHKGVIYHYNLSDADAGIILSKCVFSIIPVIPNIGYNNSSFVSTIQCGCIPIGKFNDSLKNEEFVINVKSYDVSDFVAALYESQKYDMYEVKSSLALEFGTQFSVEKTAKMMISGFEEKL